jgi:outer membrane usher protein
MNRSYSKSSRALVALALIFVGAKGYGAQPQLFRLAAAKGTRDRADVRETLLEVWINGRSTGDTVLLLKRNGKVFAEQHDLKRWRLRYSVHRAFDYRGRSYIPLDAVEGLSYTIVPKTMRLLIDAQPEAFVPSRIGTRNVLTEVTPSQPGGFFNYDLLYQNEAFGSGLNGLGEVGVFGNGGLLLGSFVYRSWDKAEVVRLDTAYRYDWPTELRTLTLGDGISRGASLWGGAVRFGGIQWGKNFRLQPTFVTTPLLSFEGEAALPSTVDLYINNTLQMQSEVPPGPFTIDHTPIMIGQGKAEIVVTDLLGREQVITGAFYATPQLLGAGLKDYTLQAGFIRQNFGVASNDYGPFFASGIYRQGITDTFTAELNGEYTERGGNLGGAGAWLWQRVGVVSMAAAMSHRDGRAGATGVIGFDHTQSGMNFGGTVRSSTEDFVQLGLLRPPARLEEHYYAGYGVQKLGSFSLDYIHRDYRDRNDVAIAGAGYHRTWKEIGTLGVSFYRTLQPRTENAFSVYFTTALGEHRSGSVGYSEDAGGSRETVRVSRNLPPGPGYGYSLAADFGTYERLEALLEWQTDYGTYRAGASHTKETDSFRASANGGIAVTDGEWFLSRRIDQSFAVVDTGALTGVGILKDNQPVGTTDAGGKLLVPNLRAYEKNPIGIEERDLPLDAVLPSLTQKVVPAYRSGVVVSFPLERTRRALLNVVLEDGTPIPPGASVQVEGQKAHFPVGRDGRLYLEGLQEHNRIRAVWDGRICEFTLDYPEGNDPMPTLGTFVCKGAKR